MGACPCGRTESKSEVRRQLSGGGIRLNDVKVEDPKTAIDAASFAGSKELKVRRQPSECLRSARPRRADERPHTARPGHEPSERGFTRAHLLQLSSGKKKHGIVELV